MNLFEVMTKSRNMNAEPNLVNTTEEHKKQ